MGTMCQQVDINNFSKQAANYLKLCQDHKSVQTLRDSFPSNGELYSIQVESFPIPENNNLQWFCLNVSLFDPTFGLFYGRTYTGPRLRAGRCFECCEEVMLIHENSFVVFEIVGLDASRRISCGWFILSQILENGQKINLPVYRGSPRCLSHLIASTDLAGQLDKVKSANLAVVSGNIGALVPNVENLIPLGVPFGIGEHGSPAQARKVRISDVSVVASPGLAKSLGVQEASRGRTEARLNLQLFNSWRFIDTPKRIHIQTDSQILPNLADKVRLTSGVSADFDCFNKDVVLTFLLESDKSGEEPVGWSLWNPSMSAGCCPIFMVPCGIPICSIVDKGQIGGWLNFRFDTVDDHTESLIPSEESRTDLVQMAVSGVDLKELPIRVEKFPKMTLSASPVGQLGAPSRNQLAWLHSAGFPPITDREGNAPHSLSLSNSQIFNEGLEMGDILQRNILTLRFLAFSRDKGDQFSTGVESLFFTFQFFNFDPVSTDRVVLDGSECALIRQPNSSLAGYQICLADTTFEPDLVRYLRDHHLHVDVWNAESLMLVGFCQLPLHVFLRQSRSAVECCCQLEIVNHEELGELTYATAGRLMLQTVNVGYPRDTADDTLMLQTVNMGYPRDVAHDTLMLQTVDVGHPTDDDGTRRECFVPSLSCSDPTRQRKLGRMQRVRMKEGWNDPRRHLRNVRACRSQNKYQQIRDALDANISRTMDITASVGRAAFFEIEVSNFLREKQLIRIEFDDPCLGVLTNYEEWRHYKMIANLSTPIEANLLSYSSEKRCPVLFLCPGEAVHVPFVYRALSVEAAQFPPTSNRQLRELIGATFRQNEQNTTKINFVSSECRILIVRLRVNLRKCPVTKVLRFLSPGNEMFKRNLTIPTNSKFSNPADIVVRCSTSDSVSVDLETRTYPRELTVKTMVGEIPSVKHMMVFIYGDAFMTSPLHSLAIFIQSCQRVDLTCVLGQLTKSRQIIRGYKSTRNIKFFVSHEYELSIEGHDGPLLADSSSDFTLSIKPLTISPRQYTVNVVDVDNNQLVHCWLVMATVIPPPVSKVFEVVLDSRGISDSFKRVSYRNTYSVERTFKLSSTRPDLVELRPPMMVLEPYGSGYIGMRFLPANRGKADIYVFVSDPNGAIEDSYMILLKIT